MDRNSEINTRGSIKVKSLSARRAWIEIVHEVFANFDGFVALRKESVDRNPPVDTSSVRESLSLSARRAWIEMFHLM